jgi:hypothetical protein
MARRMAMDRHELLWRQYKLHIGLYKDYLGLTLKVNAAFYAITGAIVTYVLAHHADAMTLISLFVPVVMGACLFLLFLYGSVMLRHTRDEILLIRDELQLRTIPELYILRGLLWVSMVGFVVVCGGVIVIWRHS